MKKVLIIASLLLTTFWCKADSALPELIFQHLTSSNGLTNPNLTTIFKDSYGLLWIGTESGLACFNGISCKLYINSATDSSTICANYIVNIIEDKYRNLWVGTQNGLARYNRSTDDFKNLTSFKSDSHIAKNFYSYPFFIDEKEHVWSNLSGSVFSINTKDGSAVFVSDKSDGRQYTGQPYYTKMLTYYANAAEGVFKITVDKKGSDYKVLLAKRGALQLVINDMLFINDTTALLCSNAGIIAFNPHTKSANYIGTYRTSTNVNAKSIARIPGLDDKFFVATAGSGLLVYDSKIQRFIHQYLYSEENPKSLSKNNLEKVVTDTDGNVFVVVHGLGLDYANLRTSQFERFLMKPQALKANIDNNVKTLAITDNGRYYIVGTENTGIVIVDANTGALSQKLLAGEGIKSVLRTNTNQYMVLTKKDKFYSILYNGNRFSTQVYQLTYQGFDPDILVFNQIIMFGITLLAATTNGLMKLVPHGKTLIISNVRNVNDKAEWLHFQRIIPINEDAFLLQAHFTNMYLVKKNGQSYSLLKEVTRTPFKTNGSITIGGTTWLATTSGLWCYQVETQELERCQLTNSYCTAITTVDSNTLWIATTAGLVSFNITDKIEHHYSEADGLQSSIFNEEATSSTASGKIIAGGANGFDVFDPKTLAGFQSNYDIILRNVLVNEKAIDKNPLTLKGITLPYYENTLALYLSPLTYTNAANQPLHYKLEGYEQNWIEGKGELTVRYPQLPPGNYNFLSYGSDKDRINSFSITIVPPFWQMWWFRILGVIVGLGIIALFVKLRLAANHKMQLQRIRWMLQSQELERKRIAGELHDDFGARLSTLKLYLQSFSNKDASHTLELTKSASQLVDNTIAELRNILMNLSPKALEENGLAAAIQDLGANISSLSTINCAVDTNQFTTKLGKDVQYSIYRICQELVNNTIKHSGASNIYISLVTRAGAVVFLYEDDGKGFNPNSVAKGYGLNNLKMHAQTIKSDLLIDSSQGKGCAATLSISTA